MAQVLKHPRLEQSHRMFAAAIRSAIDAAGGLFFPRRGDAPIHLAIGLSGAESSHALLHALQQSSSFGATDSRGSQPTSAHFFPPQITAVHVAPPAVDADNQPLQFARNQALRYGVNFHSLQDASYNCHERRTSALVKFCRSLQVDALLLADNKSDQAERLLHRLLSGELAADARSLLQVDEKLRIIRPLLTVEKRIIDDYALLFNLSSLPAHYNNNISPTHNLIRNKILPVIELRHNPRIVQALARCADRFADDDDELWRQASARLDGLGSVERANCRQLALFPPPLRWRALALLISEQLGIDGRNIPYAHLKRIEEFAVATDEPHQALTVDSGLTCVIDRQDRLTFSPVPPGEREGEKPARPRVHERGASAPAKTLRSLLSPNRPIPPLKSLRSFRPLLAQSGGGSGETLEPVRLSVPGMVLRNYGRFSHASIEARLLSADEFDLARQRGGIQGSGSSAMALAKAYFDLHKLPQLALTVREYLPGDRIRLGPGSDLDVQEVLVEHGVTGSLAERLPLVACGEDIVWIPGVACSAAAAVDLDSQEVVELSYRRRDKKHAGSKQNVLLDSNIPQSRS